MAIPENRKDWNEFEWERELRKDERRVQYYFSELPHFIDLPEEEEIILKKMKNNPELVSAGDNFEDIGNAMFFDEPEEDLFLSDDWVHKDGAKLYMQLSKLASQWSIAFASELPDSLLPDGLRITCLYGRVLAYMAELLDDEQDEMPGFSICVGKRVHAGINTLIGEFGVMAERCPGLLDEINSYVNHLQSLREKLLDLVSKSRGKQL